MHMKNRGEHSMGTEAGHMEGRNEHAEQMERHGHESWVAPPHAYTDKRNPDWDDPQAVVRGMPICAQQCAQYHGVTGIGDGPLAGSLVHRPADLSKHFHAKDGISDAYLFWRVSEGGAVEPFKSANSAMPVFNQLLNGRQRWDVLTYGHQQIHRGFVLTVENTR
jgi:mono/diheme cytochrome c family protein